MRDERIGPCRGVHRGDYVTAPARQPGLRIRTRTGGGFKYHDFHWRPNDARPLETGPAHVTTSLAAASRPSAGLKPLFISSNIARRLPPCPALATPAVMR